MRADKSMGESFLSKCKQWNRLYTMKALALVTIVCGVIGSYMYYLPYASKLLEEADRLPMWKVIIATLFSTLKLYMASPTVSLTENVNVYYEIARFTAPIYTATLGVQIFKKTWLNTWNSLQRLGKRKIFIYGYNHKSLVFINNVIKDQKKIKIDKKKIVLLIDETLTDKDRIELLSLGIVIKNINFEMPSSFETRFMFRKLNIKSNDIFVLMDKDDEKDLKLLQKIKDYLEYKPDRVTGSLKCRVLCENPGIKSMIINFDKECKDLMDVKTFNIAELGVQSLFSSKEGLIYSMSNAKHEVRNFDVRMMILGFGKIGKEVLAQAISNAVISIDNKIEFDVFDSDMEEKRAFFLKNFHQNMIVDGENNGSKSVSVILNGIDDGECRVKINFHSYDIRKNDFKQVVEIYAQQATYVAICFNEIENITNTMDLLRSCKNKNIPIAIRMSSSRSLLIYIQSLYKEYKNIFAFGTEKDLLSYQNIVNEELDNSAIENNKLYQNISHKYLKYPERKWDDLTTFEKNSNRAQALHTDMKIEYLKATKDSEYFFELIKKINLYVEDNQALYQFIQSNKDVLNLAQIEHRRWSYYLIQNGYAFCDTKDFQKQFEEYKSRVIVWNSALIKTEFKESYKVHNLLVSWTDLLSNTNSQNASILFFDLIPWMMLDKER